MNVAHSIAGYDKRSEELVFEYRVPKDRLVDVLAAAHIQPDEDDDFGLHPLSPEAARAAASKISQTVNVDRYDWFLEPSATD